MMQQTDNNDVKLEKKLSPVNVWSLALGCIIGWGAFVMPGNTFLVNAGPIGSVIAMCIATVIMMVIAVNYDYMINKFPIAGGEFTYTQKSFGETNAFICSWFLGLSYLAIVPLNGTALVLIGRNLLSNVFQFGFHYTVAGYDVYFGEVLLAVVALVLFAWLTIRGTKFTGVFQSILVFMLIGGVAVVMVAALASPKATLANLSPAFNPGVGKLSGMLAVVAVAPWAFVGFDTIPQAAEEFKFSQRKSKILMMLSIVFGTMVYSVLILITAAVVPNGYSTWVDYIADVPNLNGLASLPTFHAAYQLLGTAGLGFLGIAVLGAILSGICGFYMATSRLLYSMSKEHVLPSAFGKLHSKYKTPYVAVLFVLGIALVAPFFGRTALGWIVDMSSLGAAIGYGYTSAAAAKFARAEKKRVEFVTGVLGTIFAVVFAFLLLVPVKGLNCSLSMPSYICLLIWIVLGVIFYCASRKVRNR